MEEYMERVVAMNGKMYSLPGAAVGRKFVSCLTVEINNLGKGKANSESSICFPQLILQRDKNISEAEQCNKKLPKSQFKMTDEKAISIFTRLLLNGKIREAVRFITERQESGGVMMPHEDALKPAGKTVLEVLELKHPDQTEPHADAFVECDALPILLEVTVTEEHIRKTAHKLSGSAGPSGADSMLWQSILLKYGNQSKELREAMATLTERQANNIIEWEEIQAQKAKCKLA